MWRESRTVDCYNSELNTQVTNFLFGARLFALQQPFQKTTFSTAQTASNHGHGPSARITYKHQFFQKLSGRLADLDPKQSFVAEKGLS